MGRPDPTDYADEFPRRRGRKEEEAFQDDPDDDPEYSEPDERPRRHKGGNQPKPRYVADEEDEDDEEESHYSKQTVVHKGKKKAKSGGKEVARRRKDESSEEEEEESSEEDRKPKKKGKKGNARMNEVITKKAWENCPEEDIDEAFIVYVADTLEVSPNKVWKHAAKCLVRHTETGEYDIQEYFDRDIFPRKDQKKWKKQVEQLKQHRNKSKKDILFCTAITRDGNFGSSAYGGRPPRTVLVREPAVVPMGHSTYDHRCIDCNYENGPCGLVPVEYY
ncbi:MAG: hypothetical protein Q9201_004753 [Fulgogasparrea decipioides]